MRRGSVVQFFRQARGLRGNRRAPVSLTLTDEHHEKVERNMKRIEVTRADLLALLIDKHADTVMLAPKEPAYRRLREAVVRLLDADDVDDRRHAEATVAQRVH